MPENNIKSAIEAMLFASEKPLNIEQMRPALDNLAAQELRKAIEELKAEYEQNNRGIRIAEIAGGFQMVTAAPFSPFLKKLFRGRQSDRLSKQALETLAIIAYKQPLTRLEIETLRNVNVDGVMKSLGEKNLIRICGRKKAPGRPFVYGTTRQFMEYFGLKSLEDLPKIEELNTPQVKSELENAEIEPIPEGEIVQEEPGNITDTSKQEPSEVTDETQKTSQ